MILNSTVPGVAKHQAYLYDSCFTFPLEICRFSDVLSVMIVTISIMLLHWILRFICLFLLQFTRPYLLSTYIFFRNLHDNYRIVR
jgi:hypothetical protein